MFEVEFEKVWSDFVGTILHVRVIFLFFFLNINLSFKKVI